MANILDIFRTTSGRKLIEKTRDLTGLEENVIREAYNLIFPALVIVFKRQNEIPENNEKISEFLNSEDAEGKAKKLAKGLEKEFQKLETLSEIRNTEKNKIRSMTNLAAGFIGSIFHQVKKDEPQIEITDFLNTLDSSDHKYEKQFIESLFEEKGAQLIDDPEKTALEDGKEKDDKNPLGGYTGGR